MVCEACKNRVKDWQGSDPICSFRNGSFDDEGWNCVTANSIRELAEKEIEEVQLTRTISEQSYATISVDEVPSLSKLKISPISLYVGWYKNRGRTEAMWLMFETEAPRKPTEQEAQAIIDYYKDK